jgi:hypothetical protein
MKKIVMFAVFSLGLVGICISCLAQESIRLVTYYPAPFGVYREMRVMDGNNADIRLGVVNDAVAGGNVAGITIADVGGRPQIRFQNSAIVAAATTADFRIVQTTDDDLAFLHDNNNSLGQYTFATTNAAGTIVPGNVRVGEIFRCTTY